MLHPCFGRPWTIALNIDPPLHADRAILMPCQRPVRFCGLVEQDCADRAATRPKVFRRDCPYRPLNRYYVAKLLYAVDADTGPLRGKAV